MNGLEHVSNLLQQSTDEYWFRTVASRAYYGAFKECLLLAIKLNYTVDRTGLDHKNMRLFFELPNQSRACKILSRRLQRMHTIRKQADYEFGQKFAKGLAEEVVETYSEISEIVASMNSRRV